MLTLYNVTEAESGEYVCKVSNYIGEANQSAWLTVTRPMAKGKLKNTDWDFTWTVSPSWWKTKLWALLFLLYFWCQQPWKNPQSDWLRFVLLFVFPSWTFPPSSLPLY